MERFNDFRLNSDFGGNFNSPDQFGANRPEYFDGDFASGGGGGGYGGRPQSNYKRPSAPKRPPGLGRGGEKPSATPVPGLCRAAASRQGRSGEGVGACDALELLRPMGMPAFPMLIHSPHG